jgi:superfamily II DNA or RNA helicase
MDPLPILIDNRLRIPLAALDDELRAEIERAYTYANPTRSKLQRVAKGAFGAKRVALMHAAHAEPSQIEAWRVEGEHLTLPRGGLGGLREILTSRERGWRYTDRRTTGDPRLAPSKPWVHRPDAKRDDGGALRWYQVEAVDAVVARQNCILRAPTGSGKTSTLLGAIAKLSLPTLVVVDSAELARQWTARIAAELGLRGDDVGMIGGGECRVRSLTIGMRQSLASRAAALAKTFGVVVVDEVHRAAASTFFDVVDAFPAKYRIGASADETRADGKEFLVYAVFGVVAHEVTRDELIDDGAVLDVECRVIPTDFRADWYVRQRDAGSPDFNRLLDEMTADATRNALAVAVARDELATGEQVLVLTHRVEHAQRLRADIATDDVPCSLMLGGVEWASERATAIDAMRTGALRAAVGTIQSIGTGIDIPSVGRGVLATPIGSNRQLYQQIRGRLCRPSEGKTAVLYLLWDRHVNGAAPLKRMTEWNRSVVVRDDAGRWVDGRAYLRTVREQHAEAG